MFKGCSKVKDTLKGNELNNLRNFDWNKLLAVCFCNSQILKWLGKFIKFYKIATPLFILLTRKQGMYLQKRNCIGRMAQISAGTLIFLQAKSKVGKADIWSNQMWFFTAPSFLDKIFFFQNIIYFRFKKF